MDFTRDTTIAEQMMAIAIKDGNRALLELADEMFSAIKGACYVESSQQAS